MARLFHGRKLDWKKQEALLTQIDKAWKNCKVKTNLGKRKKINGNQIAITRYFFLI